MSYNPNLPTPLTRQAGLGTRFDFQMYREGTAGGQQWYALAGVESGMQVAATVASPTQVDVTVAPGFVRYNQVLIESTGSLTFSFTGAGFDLAEEQELYLFLNPTRRQPALAADPVAPADGDIYLNVVDVDWYQVLNEARVYNGVTTSWEKYDLMKAPLGYGHNNMILQDIVPTLAAANLSATPEKQVFLKTFYPPYNSSTPHALMRASASIALARIKVASSAAVVEAPLEISVV